MEYSITKEAKQREFIKKSILFVSIAIMVTVICFMIINPTYADAKSEIQGILTQMIDIVGLIFQAVGVVLTVYSVGQLVLAFKNEDADSKSRASTMLVVGVVLIALPSIVDGLNLIEKIGS